MLCGQANGKSVCGGDSGGKIFIIYNFKTFKINKHSNVVL